MTTGCPVCNGLTQLTKACPGCGIQMEDCGKTTGYPDPYGPYEEDTETTPEGTALTGDDQCVHFLQCPNCDESNSCAVSRDEI